MANSVIKMIDGATAPAISNVFVNNNSYLCTLQISGTYTTATVRVQGLVDTDVPAQWTDIAVFNLTNTDIVTGGAKGNGIYSAAIEGIRRVRINVTEITGGSITAVANFTGIGGASDVVTYDQPSYSVPPVTAYDIAKEGGYAGTYDDFKWDMGHSAENALIAANAAQNIAAPYPDDAPYAVGDLCIYNGAVYEANTAVPAGEAWTAAHWTQTNIYNYVDKLKVFVTPEMFGAAGDGTTDDTSAIQKTLDFSIANDIPVEFNAKTYVVSSTLSIDVSSKKWLRINGNGFLSIIKTTSAFSGDYVFDITCSNSSSKGMSIQNIRILSYSGAGGIKITGAVGQTAIFSDIWFEDYEQTTTKNGIYSNFSVCTTFRRLNFRNVRGCGLVLEEHHTNYISECDFYYCQYGIYLGAGSNLVVEKCRIDEGQYGIYCNGSNNQLTDSRIYNFLSVLISCTFNCNRFEHNTKYAMVMIAYGNNHLAHQGLKISNNYFDTLSSANGALGIAVGRIRGLDISNNTFKGDAYNSSLANANDQNIQMTSNVSNVSIKGNVAALVTDGGGGYYSSNSRIASQLCNLLNFVSDINVNQSSVIDLNNNRNYYNISSSSITDQTINVSEGNVFIIPDGTTIATISCDDVGQLRQMKEITFIFAGAGTVKGGTSSINLAGNTDFVATQYSTLTLIGGYLSGNRWYEKSRSIK